MIGCVKTYVLPRSGVVRIEKARVRQIPDVLQEVRGATTGRLKAEAWSESWGWMPRSSGRSVGMKTTIFGVLLDVTPEQDTVLRRLMRKYYAAVCVPALS